MTWFLFRYAELLNLDDFQPKNFDWSQMSKFNLNYLIKITFFFTVYPDLPLPLSTAVMIHFFTSNIDLVLNQIQIHKKLEMLLPPKLSFGAELGLETKPHKQLHSCIKGYLYQ